MTPIVIIPEVNPQPHRRLGRHIQTDVRSDAFVHEESKVVLRSVTWARSLPPLDQGDIGACTGNALAGILATAPSTRKGVNESLALHIYHEATVLDGDPGTWPPDDTGTSVLAACRAAVRLGYIKGYRWARSLSAVCSALQHGPVDFGVNWYEGMDSPDLRGLVHVTGDVRGGHSFEVIGLDVEASEVICENSWGVSWGDLGRFRIGFQDVERLLSEQGEAASVILP